MATKVLLTGSETYTGGNGDYIVTDNLLGTDTASSVGSNTLTLGNGIDQVTFGSGGSNTIVLGGASDTSNDTLMIGGGSNKITVNGSGNNQITTVGGINTVTVGSGSNTIRLGEAVSGSPDTLTTAAGGNTVFVSAAAITGDTLNGATASGDGTTNRLVLSAPGTMSPVNVSGFAIWKLANHGPNSLTLAEVNFARLPGGRIIIDGGNAGNTINAAALSAAHSVLIVGGFGPDVLTGGAGNDVFKYSVGALVNTDTITGGGGSNTLLMTNSGTVRAGGVSGVETYTLASGGYAGTLGSGGANTVALTSANFTGVGGHIITVNDGNSGNTINASTLLSADAIIVHAGTGTDKLTGGAGNDIFYAGGKTTMTGGGGANQFTFASIGTNTIADFEVAGSSNELVFSNSGFKLGFSGATSTPTLWTAAEIAAHFSTRAGTYAGPSAGFDYTGGKLFYSATGNSGNQHLVAALSGSPVITAASQLFVVS